MTNQNDAPSKLIRFMINDQPVEAREGWTVLNCPSVRYPHPHPLLSRIGGAAGCRLCVVGLGRKLVQGGYLHVPGAEDLVHRAIGSTTRRGVLEMLAECPASRSWPRNTA
jgi:hypothetical protein